MHGQDCKDTNAKLQEMLMSKWWDQSPEAGPPTLQGAPIEQRTPSGLKVTSWTSDHPVLLKDTLLSKFSSGTPAYSEMEVLIQDFWREFGRYEGQSSEATHEGDGTNRRELEPGEGEGPTWSEEEKVKVDMNLPVSLTPWTLGTDVTAATKSKHNVSLVFKDATLGITCNEDVTLKTKELLGFNTGTYIEKELHEIDPKDGIAYIFDSDQALVTLVVEGSKKLMTVAEAIWFCFRTYNIPQIGIEGHCLTKRTYLKNGETHVQPWRFDIQQQGKVYIYQPDKVAEAQDMNPAVFGALLEQPDLPHQSARLVWEMQVDQAPPSQLRPLKPKVYFVGIAELASGSTYQLEWSIRGIFRCPFGTKDGNPYKTP